MMRSSTLPASALPTALPCVSSKPCPWARADRKPIATISTSPSSATNLRNAYDLVPSVMAGGLPCPLLPRQRHRNPHRLHNAPLPAFLVQPATACAWSADGTLHLCLGNSHNMALRPHLRDGISDSGLRDLLIEALALKPWQHNFEEQPEHVARSMATTGG